jgi:aminopeptidase N
VLSNGAEIESNLIRSAEGTFVEHIFETTPPMSTYLVGIVVGDLESEQLLGHHGGDDQQKLINVTAYGRIGTKDSLRFAAEAAIAAINGAIKLALSEYAL